MNLPPIDTLPLQDARDEVARLRAELEQQRTRAEGAEQELRDVERREDEGVKLFDQIGAELRAKQAASLSKITIYAGKLQDKLAAARAHLAGVDWGELQALEVDLRRMEDPSDSDFASLIAAAREVLS